MMDMPDPRAYDECVWEDRYLAREPVDTAELVRELRRLEAVAAASLSTPDDELREIAARIDEIEAILEREGA